MTASIISPFPAFSPPTPAAAHPFWGWGGSQSGHAGQLADAGHGPAAVKDTDAGFFCVFVFLAHDNLHLGFQ
ncbi:MAG: hypothetical protein PVG71_13820 [Anaerolineae bacterium]|jgi:hypothetical protein